MTKTLVERGKRVVCSSFGGRYSRGRCCVRGARVLRKRLSALQREQKKNGGASVLVERVSGKTV